MSKKSPTSGKRDGRAVCGVARTLKRRRRSFFMRGLPRELLAAALHDEARDRLVLVQARDGILMNEFVRFVGCATSR